MNDETREILLILQEECAEVIVEISKCMRFGPDQIKPGSSETNIQFLEQELADVLVMIDLLVKQNVGVNATSMESKTINKINKLKKWSKIKF